MDELPVIGGQVRCPERSWTDVEVCLACPALRAVEGGRRPSVLRCTPFSARRGRGSRLPSFADPATLA